MAHSVLIGIATASIALALTASIAIPSMAMSFSDYDSSAAPLGSRADVGELFSGRLTAAENRRAREAAALQEIRQGRITPVIFDANEIQIDETRPISLTLPF